MKKSSSKKDTIVDEFHKYLFDTDIIAVTLKCHMFIERAIDNYLGNIFSKPDIIIEKMSFSQKIDIKE